MAHGQHTSVSKTWRGTSRHVAALLTPQLDKADTHLHPLPRSPPPPPPSSPLAQHPQNGRNMVDAVAWPLVDPSGRALLGRLEGWTPATEVRAAWPHLRPSPHVDRHLRQPEGSSRSWRKEPRKRGYLTRRVSPMQALRLAGKPLPRPVPPSNPVHPHPMLAPLNLVPILVAKSIPDGECWTTELTSECMTAKELLVPPVLREVQACQLHKSILVQLNQAPGPTREVPVLPMGALDHLRAALGSLRYPETPRGAEAMRWRWEWVRAAVWTLAATPSRGRQATAAAATQVGCASQMEPL